MLRTLAPADNFNFRNAADARIAPDGQAIIFLLTTRDITNDRRRNTLMLRVGDGDWQELTSSAGASLARWAPDSRRIAFLRHANGAHELVVHDIASGRETILVQSATALRELAWSADGKLLAYQQREITPLPAWLGLATPPEGAQWAAPIKLTERLVWQHDTVGEWPEGCFQVFTTAADGSAIPRQITSGVWWNGMPHMVSSGLCFTKDGGKILLTGNQRADWDRTPSDIDIHAISLNDLSVQKLTDFPGPVARPTPSPDGKLLAYTAVEERGLSHQRRKIFVMPIAGGPARALTESFDLSIDDIAWTDDSQALMAAYDMPGKRALARFGLDGSHYVLTDDIGPASIEMPYSGGGFSRATDGTVAYVRAAVDVPSEVATIAPDGRKSVLTALNAGLAQQVGGFLPAEMFWTDCDEGRQVQSWLVKPRGRGPHPMALLIHGGPYAQFGERFSIKVQALAAAGYAVLYSNPAGSTGYGEDFANSLHDRFPGPDHDDLMRVVDAAAARPDIDADNLFITGTSGGGVLTCWAVTHDHRFRAAVAIKPVVDWQSWMLTADMGATGGLTWLGHDLPWDAAAKYRERSPLTYAAHSRTPTLLIAGEADSRTPPTEAIQMYTALKLAGCEAALLRMPGVSHGTGAMRPSYFAAEISATLGWFGRFRTGG
jgi:dipeptidyl aminopeptidase/acylaminoacyl peptidase